MSNVPETKFKQSNLTYSQENNKNRFTFLLGYIAFWSIANFWVHLKTNLRTCQISAMQIFRENRCQLLVVNYFRIKTLLQMFDRVQKTHLLQATSTFLFVKKTTGLPTSPQILRKRAALNGQTSASTKMTFA